MQERWSQTNQIKVLFIHLQQGSHKEHLVSQGFFRKYFTLGMNPFQSNNLINFYQTEPAEEKKKTFIQWNLDNPNTSGDLPQVAQGP